MVEKLTAEQIIYTNEQILRLSIAHPDLLYCGDYAIKTEQLDSLVSSTPDSSLAGVGTYYIKNLILLQIFSDANHRTSFASLDLFFFLNHLICPNRPTLRKASVSFYEKSLRIQYYVYQTYEEMPVSVLSEEENKFYLHWKQFVSLCLAEYYQEV